VPQFIVIGNPEDDLHLAGDRVTAGLYREIESGREVRIATEDYLPATNDGRVAAYARSHPWGQGHVAASSSPSTRRETDP